jgi:hypothetical protein
MRTLKLPIELPDPFGPAASGVVLLAAAAPWLLGFSASHAAVANGIAFLMAFSPLALMAPALRPAAAVCVVAGAWLALSPWVLGYWSVGIAAWAADLVLGVGLGLMSWRALSLDLRSTMVRG